MVNEVGLGRVDGICHGEQGEEDRREDECMLNHDLLGSSNEATSTSSFREAFATVGLYQRHVSKRDAGVVLAARGQHT